MTAIQKFLSECREIEAKATPGNWDSDFDGDVFTDAPKELCPGMEPDLFHCFYNIGSTRCGPDRGDAEFIAFSRNNFLKLVECVSVLSEACEYYIGRSGSRVAQQTLEKVESILKSE